MNGDLSNLAQQLIQYSSNSSKMKPFLPFLNLQKFFPGFSVFGSNLKGRSCTTLRHTKNGGWQAQTLITILDETERQFYLGSVWSRAQHKA